METVSQVSVNTGSLIFCAEEKQQIPGHPQPVFIQSLLAFAQSPAVWHLLCASHCAEGAETALF